MVSLVKVVNFKYHLKTESFIFLNKENITDITNLVFIKYI